MKEKVVEEQTAERDITALDATAHSQRKKAVSLPRKRLRKLLLCAKLVLGNQLSAMNASRDFISECQLVTVS